MRTGDARAHSRGYQRPVPRGSFHMTTTTTTTLDSTEEPTRRQTPGTTALLIGAPLLMAIARVLLVPFDDEDWDAVMTSMAANQGRSDTGWLLAIVASGLLAVTAVVLANRLR